MPSGDERRDPWTNRKSMDIVVQIAVTTPLDPPLTALILLVHHLRLRSLVNSSSKKRKRETGGKSESDQSHHTTPNTAPKTPEPTHSATKSTSIVFPAPTRRTTQVRLSRHARETLFKLEKSKPKNRLLLDYDILHFAMIEVEYSIEDAVYEPRRGILTSSTRSNSSTLVDACANSRTSGLGSKTNLEVCWRMAGTSLLLGILGFDLLKAMLDIHPLTHLSIPEL
ncbi:hypothetical protein BGZ57DRAFT_1004195 [Hyaloscypha finlandica]|nr:hypothetical protein BGZ57DRAFT_1004195 [Hyaloscypha finlandica]